jgi:hypothetical protein
LQKSNVFFREASVSGRDFFPRAIMVDLEPGATNTLLHLTGEGVLDSIKTSSTSKLFCSDNFISASSGAGNNWAKGFYTEGAELCDDVLEVSCISPVDVTSHKGSSKGSRDERQTPRFSNVSLYWWRNRRWNGNSHFGTHS